MFTVAAGAAVGMLLVALSAPRDRRLLDRFDDLRARGGTRTAGPRRAVGTIGAIAVGYLPDRPDDGSNPPLRSTADPDGLVVEL